MKNILELIEQKKQELDQSPFHQFMRDRSIPLRQRFSFAPYVSPWVLGFSSINKYVLRDESSKHPLQQLINVHTHEDDHHFGMFQKDLRLLGLNKAMDLNSALTLLWSEKCEAALKAVLGVTALIAQASPELRLVIVETLEGLGNTTFKMYLEPAEEFYKETGERLSYFGQSHLDRESGHAMGTQDIEQKLDAVELTPEQEQEARRLVEKVAEYILDMGRQCLEHARPRTDMQGVQPAAAVQATR